MTHIQIGKPNELNLDCGDFEKEGINCSHAFPDLQFYEGRFYLAFRSAPNHFPSRKSQIVILSSKDRINWKLDFVFNGEEDVRDPHFLVHRGKLHIFFIKMKKNPMGYKPDAISFSTLNDSTWSNLRQTDIPEAGFWGIHSFKEKAYISIYTNYGKDKKKTNRHMRFFTSEDLEHWVPMETSASMEKALNDYQTSEGSFIFNKEGNIFGTIRSEIYPNVNFFAKSIHASDWKINIDKFKCDGPRLFGENNRYFLIGRRSLFYKLPRNPLLFLNTPKKLFKILRYWFSKKRTAIFEFDQDNLKLKHISDLPSHGDTGYAAVEKISKNKFLIVYYSSEISNGEDLNWLQGQLGKTKLYTLELELS